MIRLHKSYHKFVYKTADILVGRTSLQTSFMANRLSPQHLQFGAKLSEMTGSKNFLTWKSKFSTSRAACYISSQSLIILLLSRSKCFKSQRIHCLLLLAARASLAGVHKRSRKSQARACPPLCKSPVPTSDHGQHWASLWVGNSPETLSFKRGSRTAIRVESCPENKLVGRYGELHQQHFQKAEESFPSSRFQQLQQTTTQT